MYPVRKLYPAATVARHLAALGAAARPLTLYGADGAGVRVALLDGPVDSGHSYLHLSGPGWNAVDGKPQAPRPDPGRRGARHRDGGDRRRPAAGPAGLHGVAPAATLLPIQILELQHGDLMGTTATLLAGTRPRPRSERRRQPVRPRERDPGPGRRAVRGLRRLGRDGRLGERRAARAPCSSRQPGNDGPTDARFGTIASPAASPGWLAVGATDGRAKLPRANLTLRADGSENDARATSRW